MTDPVSRTMMLLCALVAAHPIVRRPHHDW